MPPRTKTRRKEDPVPSWGWWLTGSLISLFVITTIIASGAIPRAFSHLGTEFSHLLSGAGFICILAVLAAFYLLPTIIATSSPRVAAILVANIVFGWTGIGWIIVLIWALAESGTAKQKQTPPPP